MAKIDPIARMERMMKKTNVTILLVLAFLLASQVMVVPTEARLCEVPSRTFRYLCVFNRSCDNACRTEGFPDGHCKGVRKRCICRKPC